MTMAIPKETNLPKFPENIKRFTIDYDCDTDIYHVCKIDRDLGFSFMSFTVDNISDAVSFIQQQLNITTECNDTAIDGLKCGLSGICKHYKQF